MSGHDDHDHGHANPPGFAHGLPAYTEGAVRPAGPIDAATEGRIDRVLAALAQLNIPDPRPWAQGLGQRVAREGLGAALGAIRRPGLVQALGHPGAPPPDLSLVVPYGVFTTPIEWTALYAAAGCRLTIKAPAQDPAFCQALAAAFQSQDLPVQVQTERGLGQPSAVVAMGSDASLAAIRAATPGARHALFGHRFSAVVVGDPRYAQALAWDLAMYDARGCMAPTAVFVPGDAADAMVDALATAMDTTARLMPVGAVDLAVGPERRRRLGLARVLGRVVEGPGGAVARLPLEHFTPFALPQVAMVHAVPSGAALRSLLHPWRHQLSSLGINDLTLCQDPDWSELVQWFPRRTAPGALQRPAFPRLHDGVHMLGCVSQPPT